MRIQPASFVPEVHVGDDIAADQDKVVVDQALGVERPERVALQVVSCKGSEWSNWDQGETWQGIRPCCVPPTTSQRREGFACPCRPPPCLGAAVARDHDPDVDARVAVPLGPPEVALHGVGVHRAEDEDLLHAAARQPLEDVLDHTRVHQWG